jgi:hypothetical protein
MAERISFFIIGFGFGFGIGIRLPLSVLTERTADSQRRVTRNCDSLYLG